MKVNPAGETQAAADRVYKLRDTEETPRLLLLAPLHSAATGEPNIWVDKEANMPDSHQGQASCSMGKDVTNKWCAERHARTRIVFRTCVDTVEGHVWKTEVKVFSYLNHVLNHLL